MKTIYSVADDGKTLYSERSFAASVERVWEAWTNSELLDKWWGPLPYKAVTHNFSFTEGGAWRYTMEGPEGDKHYCINTYHTINPVKEFTAEDAFCNEDWSINTDLPKAAWKVEFKPTDGGTTVFVTTTYASAQDLETVVKMGMKEGFDMGLNQLEALLAS